METRTYWVSQESRDSEMAASVLFQALLRSQLVRALQPVWVSSKTGGEHQQLWSFLPSRSNSIKDKSVASFSCTTVEAPACGGFPPGGHQILLDCFIQRIAPGLQVVSAFLVRARSFFRLFARFSFWCILQFHACFVVDCSQKCLAGFAVWICCLEICGSSLVC